MIFNKIFLISFFLFSIILSNTLKAESLTFGSSIYEGEIKKGKAHGKGILTFSDDTTYEGNFKKNRPHGVGIYIDARENTYEGKWRNGKLKVKLDKKTRRIIKLSVEEGQTNFFEIRALNPPVRIIVICFHLISVCIRFIIPLTESRPPNMIPD